MPPENVLGSKHMANADFAPIVKRNKRTYLYSLLIVHIKLCLCGLVSNVLGFPSQSRSRGAPTKTKTIRVKRCNYNTVEILWFLQQVVANLKSGRKIYLTLLFVLNDPLPCIWSFSSRKQVLFRMHISAVRGNPSSSAAAEFRFYAKEPTAANLNLCHSSSRFEPPGCSEIFSLSLTLPTGTCNIAICEQKAKG